MKKVPFFFLLTNSPQETTLISRRDKGYQLHVPILLLPPSPNPPFILSFLRLPTTTASSNYNSRRGNHVICQSKLLRQSAYPPLLQE